MALKSDIYVADENRPVDLKERQVVPHHAEMSNDVLDLRKQQEKTSQEDQNVFFEFLPTAGTLTAPPVEFGQLKQSLGKQYQRAAAFVRRHPRYFIAGLLVLAAILLFSLSAMTRRTVIRSNPDTPTAATTTITESSTPPVSAAATTTDVAPDAASNASNTQSAAGVGGPTTITAPSGTQTGGGTDNSTPPTASVEDPKVCVGSACIEVTSPLLEPVNPLIPEAGISL